MATPREDNRASEFIDSLQKEKMKTHCKRDGSQRVIILYEAPVHVQDGDPCLATIYEYSGANSVPENSQEKSAIWSVAWDFDVLVNGEIGYVD